MCVLSVWSVGSLSRFRALLNYGVRSALRAPVAPRPVDLATSRPARPGARAAAARAPKKCSPSGPWANKPHTALGAHPSRYYLFFFFFLSLLEY